MDQEFPQKEKEFKFIPEYIEILKKYKFYSLLIFSLITLLSIGIAIKLPNVYKSTASILINQDNIPKDLVKSVETNYIEQRIQIIKSKIMSTENLSKIVDKFDLYPEMRETRSPNSMADRMREAAHMEFVGGSSVVNPSTGKLMKPTIGFTVSFDSHSPELAQKVTSELVNLYLNENIKQRTKVVEGAKKFLEQETDKLLNKISELESEIAKFKEENVALLPEVNRLNLSRVDRLDQQIRDSDTKIQALSEKISSYQIQLSTLNPHVTVFSAKGERIYGADDRLIILQAEYAALSSKYSTDHPDLVKMRKEISSLQREAGGSFNQAEYQKQLNDKQAELSGLMERYSEEHPDIKKLKIEIENLKTIIEKSPKAKRISSQSSPTNPAYVNLQSIITSAQAELKAMLSTREKLASKLFSYEQKMTKVPEVERKYQALMRDYENATAKYREVKAKQMEASMAESMEKNTQGAEFILLEPPLVPETPFKPNRKAIVFLGILASVFISLGFIVIKESLKPTVYTSGRLASIIGEDPLVVVPYLNSKKIG